MKKNMTLAVATATATGHPELDAAVQDLYAVFGGYPAPAFPLDVCLACCVDGQVERELRELPLRSLTARHFYQYNGSAKGTVQPVGELKYLLPRLFELLAQGAELHHSTELYLDRLGRCDPQVFSPVERAAIDRFALAHFRAGLAQWPSSLKTLFMGETAFSILLMWDIGGVDVSPLLVHWLADASDAATLHYIDASHWDFWSGGGGFANAFASERTPLNGLLNGWMNQASHRRVFAERILALVENGLPGDWLPSTFPAADLRQRAAEVFDAIVD